MIRGASGRSHNRAKWRQSRDPWARALRAAVYLTHRRIPTPSPALCYCITQATPKSTWARRAWAAPVRLLRPESESCKPKAANTELWLNFQAAPPRGWHHVLALNKNMTLIVNKHSNRILTCRPATQSPEGFENPVMSSSLLSLSLAIISQCCATSSVLRTPGARVCVGDDRS